MDAEAETLLRALFPLVEFDPDISSEINDEPAWHINRRDEYFVMREDALRIVHRLREMLAAPALGDDGGLHPDAVRNYIADACVDAHLDGEDVAVDRFRSMVTAPLMDVWVAVPAPIHFQGLKLVFGRCEVVHEIPDDAIVDLTLREERDEFKAAAFITTVVSARDQQSAEMRARDHFDEARALLRLISNDGANYPVPSHVWLHKGQYGNALRVTETGVVRGSDENGALWPGYRHLSDSMAKPEANKTDWERRTIDAARWYHHAMCSQRPAGSLAACFTALETLLVVGKSVSRKGAAIAERVVQNNARVRGIDASELQDWLQSLYEKHRNNAVHEGIGYANELEVARLEELTRSAVQWAASHLDPDHRSAGVCATFDEVHHGDHS